MIFSRSTFFLHLQIVVVNSTNGSLRVFTLLNNARWYYSTLFLLHILITCYQENSFYLNPDAVKFSNMRNIESDKCILLLWTGFEILSRRAKYRTVSTDPVALFAA